VVFFARQFTGPRWQDYRRLRACVRGGAWCGGIALALGLFIAVVEGLIGRGPRRLDLAAPPGGWGAVSFSPDGRTLAAGGQDQKVWLWDVSGPAPRERARLGGHTASVRAVAFTLDGRTLASAGADGTARLWALDGDAPRERAVLRGPASVSGLAFSPDGQALVTACGDHTVRLWDVGREAPCERVLDPGQALFVRSLAFAADGRTLALGCSDKTVRLWDLGGRAPRERLVVRGLAQVPDSLAPSPDGKALALGQADGSVRLWDLGADVPRERALLKAPALRAPRVQFSPDGKALLVAGEELRLWDVRGPAPRELALPRRPTLPSWAAFSPDGRTLALGDGKWNDTLLWDLSGGRPRERGAVGRRSRGAAFSPDGRTLLSLTWSSTGTGTAVAAWYLDSRRLKRETALEEGGVGGIGTRVFSPDGRTVATFTYVDLGLSSLVVWSTATGKRLHAYRLPVTSEHWTAFAYAPDGRHLAVDNVDGTVYILRIKAWPDAALAWCAQALRRDPNHVEALLLRGRLYLERREGGRPGLPDSTGGTGAKGAPKRSPLTHQQALADLTAAIRLDPKSAAARELRGTWYLWDGQPGPALKDFDEAIRLDKGCVQAWFLRGRVHACRKDHERAVADFSEAIRLEPGNAQAYYQRGLAHADRGDYARAKADLTQAVRLDPGLAPGAPPGK
jgi:WD40 repeat protein